MRGLFVGTVVATLALSLGLPLSGQEHFASRKVIRIGIVARDAAKTAAAYAGTFGLPAPAPLTNNPATAARATEVQFDNLVVEVAEPLAGSGPLKTYLDTYGEGLHHVAFAVPDVSAQARFLESKGGTRLLTSGSDYALVDLRTTLGVNIALHKGTSTPLTDEELKVKATQRASGGIRTLARIGLMVPETDKARAAYMDIFGVSLPNPVNEQGALKFPEGFTGDTKSGMRHIFMPFDNLWINVIQPIGGESPWRDMLTRHDGYLLFAVDNVEEQAQALEKKGGTRTLGQPGTAYAYVDMQKSLGMTVFLLRSGVLPR